MLIKSGTRAERPPVTEWPRIASVPLHPGRVVAELAASLPSNSLVCVDGPRIERWVTEGIPSLASGGVRVFSVPGTGVSCAIGMKLALPERPVFVVTDGDSAARAAMELTAAARHGAAISLLIADDGGAAVVRAPSARSAPQRARYELLAEFAGGVGDVVETPQQLAIALTNALVSTVPTIVDALVDPMVRYPESD